MRLATLILATALLAACTPEAEPVANRFDRTSAELENKARALENEVDGEVRAVESQMQNEIDAYVNQAAANETTEANVTNGAR